MRLGISVNLLPRARRLRLARRARARGWMAACLCWAGVLGLGVTGYRAAEAPARAGSARAVDPETFQRRLAEANGQLRLVRADLQSAKARMAVASSIENHPDWSRLLRLLAGLRGDEVQLRSVEASLEAPPPPPPGARGARQPAAGSSGSGAGAGSAKAAAPRPERYTVRLEGLAKGPESVTAFVLALERLGLFSAVRLVETKPKDYFGLPMAGFRVECVLTDRGVADPLGPQAKPAPVAGASADAEAVKGGREDGAR